MLALDVSEYGGLISVAQWREAKARGYEFAIVQAHGGRWANPYCEPSLRNAKTAGLYTAAYVLIMDEYSGLEYAQFARDACGYAWDDLRACFVDVEGYGATEDQAWETCQAIKTYHGKPYGLYTSRHFWQQVGNPPWQYTPLWVADYDHAPSLIPEYPLGAWRKAVGHQFTGTTTVAGISCDINYFDREWVLNG